MHKDYPLVVAGSTLLLAALLHVAAIFGGPPWFAFLGAPEGLIQMAGTDSLRPAISCLVIGAVLVVVAVYAFSGAGFIRRLPGLRWVLGVTGARLVLRAVVFPVVPAGRYVQETVLGRLRPRFGAALVPLHRIDRETAGLVLCSIDPATRGVYQALFRDRRITKQYEALAPPLPQVAFPQVRASRLVRGAPLGVPSTGRSIRRWGRGAPSTCTSPVSAIRKVCAPLAHASSGRVVETTSPSVPVSSIAAIAAPASW